MEPGVPSTVLDIGLVPAFVLDRRTVGWITEWVSREQPTSWTQRRKIFNLEIKQFPQDSVKRFHFLQTAATFSHSTLTFCSEDHNIRFHVKVETDALNHIYHWSSSIAPSTVESTITTGHSNVLIEYVMSFKLIVLLIQSLTIL